MLSLESLNHYNSEAYPDILEISQPIDSVITDDR